MWNGGRMYTVLLEFVSGKDCMLWSQVIFGIVCDVGCRFTGVWGAFALRDRDGG